MLFTSLERHFDEASPALLTMDVLGLFVLVFLAHSCLALFRVRGRLVFPPSRVSRSLQGLRIRRHVSLHFSQVFDVSAVAVLCWSLTSPSLQMQVLSCPAVLHRVHYLVPGGFFAQHKDSRRFVFMCRYCHMLMVCFRSSFLWSSIIADMFFAVMLLLGQEQQGLRVYGVAGGVQAGVLVVLVCDGHVHALTQLTCQWTRLSCRWTHLSCRRTQL